jgi:(R,R)-butanediol dehydrogenase/meso-butanediol dehydrogenase/diacetyl reductase
LTVRLLAWLEVPTIVAVDVVRSRLCLAGELGATDLVDPGKDGTVAEQIRELTDGQGVDVAFEVVGAQDTVRSCLDATRKGGRVILVGLAGELCVDAFSLVNNEQSIITSVGYRDCHPELIRLVAEEELDLSPIVTATIGLDDVVSGGFETLLGGRDQIKVLVRPKGVR